MAFRVVLHANGKKTSIPLYESNRVLGWILIGICGVPSAFMFFLVYLFKRECENSIAVDWFEEIYDMILIGLILGVIGIVGIIILILNRKSKERTEEPRLIAEYRQNVKEERERYKIGH